MSRPANTLAAVATVTAQASRQQTNTGTASTTTGEPRAEGSGNLLLNGAPTRTANVNSSAKANTPQTAANAPPAGAASTTPSTDAQPPVPVAPLPPAQQVPNAANRPAMPLLRGGEPVALDTVNGTTTTGSTASTAAARVVAPTTRPTIPPRVLTEQIAVQVQKSVGQGLDRIKIQLKPAELGRVEIKLDVMQDGRVAATVIAERPETLELLQRDSRGLQQALQDAGLKSDNASLSFNLGGGNASDGQQSAGDGGDGIQSGEDAETLAENDDAPGQRRASDSLIDVEV
ncbi:MAG: hypothetical protein GKS00_09870 [Alphaproteobacteria bacterium]|nr:hypothetical protein [Alphaproteobacteria bacterium]